MFFVDIVTVAIGLALVLGHNVWSGGPLAIAVTLMGWATLVKGLALLCQRNERMSPISAT
jgi:hypothetical protein